MSVINQMLLDLERRRASGEERNRIPDHVRALPGGTAIERDRTLPLVIAVAAGLCAGAAGVYWWWHHGISGVARPSLIASGESENAERVARRMSLDLAKVPPVDVATVADAAAPSGISTQSIVVSEPSVSTGSRVERVVSRGPLPQEAAIAAAKPQAAVAQPETKPAAPVTPSAAIDKRVREPMPRQRAEAEYARAAAALQQGSLSDARSGFEAALQADPAYHAARQALAGVLIDARQPADAMLVLQEGLQLAPPQFGFAMMAARLHVERGELDAAVQTLARSAEYASGNADYAGFYAGLLQRQKRHAEAIEQFDRALRLRPGAGIWMLGMGISLEALGRSADAQEAFRRARASGNLTPELQAYADQRSR